MNLIQKVEELMTQYGNDTQYAIGEFVLNERASLYKYSIQEIADRTHTSKASLVRFAKKLGFTGWREFIKTFIEEERYYSSHYSDIDTNYPFEKGTNSRDIIHKISSLEVECILDTADLLNEKVIDEVVQCLKKAKRIALFGTYPNNSMGELFAKKMLNIGRIIDMPRYGNMKTYANSLTKNDAAIIISYSGNNPLYDPIVASEILKKRDIPVIAITSAGENNLSRNADYVLNVFSQEEIYSKISSFGTETSIIFILNVIFAAYFCIDYDKNLKKKIANGAEFEFNRTVK